MTSKCIFCTKDLAPGSEEHVFLSALGGRLITTHATCVQCNNDFAKSEFGKIDDALAEAFLQIRCALLIRTGRDQPPPTIPRAGRIPDGPEYDLAPGMVPLSRAARVPDFGNVKGGAVTVPARDEKDAKRILDIAKRRGLSPTLKKVESVTTKVPWTKLSFTFDGTKVWRAIAKTALLGSCVLYGNEAVRTFTDAELRRSVKVGDPEISNHAGWDYVNAWPTVVAATPHRHTPSATASNFDHSLMVADVGNDCVAYVKLFGAFRFSLRMGQRTGLEPRGIALNPRAPGRLQLSITAPPTYKPRHIHSLRDEANQSQAGLRDSMTKVFSAWDKESTHQHIEDLSEELQKQIAAAGSDEVVRGSVVAEWAARITQLELGNAWRTELNKEFYDDEPA